MSTHIKVCQGASCHKNMSAFTLERAEKEASKRTDITVEGCGCQGHCEKGPTVIIEKNGDKKVHHHVSSAEMGQLIKQTK